MTQSRPYREALDEASVAHELRNQAEAGRLDQRAVECVLEAAGHGVRARRIDWPAGLTEREVEVLRLIALGKSNREVAGTLTISVKTVGRHIENIYAKTGISSRATAALFAMEHRLL
jgi:DNA-binding NarL/FixJ family response regulator